MTTILIRPVSEAPLRVHLNHFLKFIVQVNVGEHQQLLVASLQYLLSIALSPLYKIRIQRALEKVAGLRQRQVRVTRDMVRQNLKEYSSLYADLMDKIVICTDHTWALPKQGSDPSVEVVRMDQAWQQARRLLELSTIWDLTD